MGRGSIVGDVEVGVDGTAGAMFSPGLSATNEEVGAIAIMGDYTQGSGGVFEVDMEDTSTFDSIDVSGTAALGGTLRLKPSANINAGDEFILIQAADLADVAGSLMQFERIEIEGRDDLYFRPEYFDSNGPGTLIGSGDIAAASVGSFVGGRWIDTGDANGINGIDMEDARIFASVISDNQLEYEFSTGGVFNDLMWPNVFDFNSDGRIDVDDIDGFLTQIQAVNGMSAGQSQAMLTAALNGTTVPESSSVAMLVAALSGALLVSRPLRRHKRAILAEAVDEPLDERAGLDRQAARSGQVQEPVFDLAGALGTDLELGELRSAGIDRCERDDARIQGDTNEGLHAAGLNKVLGVRGKSKNFTTGKHARFSRILHGFTLVELLVVIAIISVLMALLLPAVQAAREAARRSICSNNLKQMGLAMQNHHTEKRSFPASGVEHPFENQRGVSWRVYLLPYMEQQNVFDLIGVTPQGGASDWNQSSVSIPEFRCPSLEQVPVGQGILQISTYSGINGADRAGGRIPGLETRFCGNLFVNGVLHPGKPTTLSKVTDGTSNTIAIGERIYVFDPWMVGATWKGRPVKNRYCSQASGNVVYRLGAGPNDHGYYISDLSAPAGVDRIPLNDLYFGSVHTAGAFFSFADGSVQFLNENIEFTVFQDLATINGGEVNQWSQ